VCREERGTSLSLGWRYSLSLGWRYSLSLGWLHSLSLPLGWRYSLSLSLSRLAVISMADQVYPGAPRHNRMCTQPPCKRAVLPRAAAPWCASSQQDVYTAPCKRAVLPRAAAAWCASSQQDVCGHGSPAVTEKFNVYVCARRGGFVPSLALLASIGHLNSAFVPSLALLASAPC
jgi:hypothetical protein